MKRLILPLAFSLFASAAHAEVQVDFIEGAPKDRFKITNLSTCDFGKSDLQIELSKASGLIFDVTGNGAGVEVFQPLEIVTGREYLSNLPLVKDGDTSISFQIASLPAGKSINFTIDVDDTLGGREITVSRDEITGTRVSMNSGGAVWVSTMSKNSSATLPATPCA